MQLLLVVIRNARLSILTISARFWIHRWLLFSLSGFVRFFRRRERNIVLLTSFPRANWDELNKISSASSLFFFCLLSLGIISTWKTLNAYSLSLSFQSVERNSFRGIARSTMHVSKLHGFFLPKNITFHERFRTHFITCNFAFTMILATRKVKVRLANL